MLKRVVSLFLILVLSLCMIPTTGVKAQEQSQVDILWVGNTHITGEGYWKTDEQGSLISSDANDYNVAFDGNHTLTLKDATINGVRDENFNKSNAGIYVESIDNRLLFEIKVEGNNLVSGDIGIYAYSNNEDVNLIINEFGNLNVQGNQHGLMVQSNNSYSNLTIQAASVISEGGNYTWNTGVLVQTGQDYNGTIEVNNGTLQTSGNLGIDYRLGSSFSGSGIPQLSVNGSSMVDAKNGGIEHNTNNDLKINGNGGIIFNGGNGTVYGNTNLKNDLTIGEGESLALSEGAQLNPNGHILVVDGGTIDESIKNGFPDSVKYTPSITTTVLSDGIQNASYNQILSASGTDPITWSITGNLPDGLSLNENTGEITGTPTAAGSYSFTINAVNIYGSDSKEMTIEIMMPTSYSVSVTPYEVGFPTVTEGYGPQEARTIIIENTGDETIYLGEPVSEHYLDMSIDKDSLEPNEKATITITLKEKLNAVIPTTLQSFITYTNEDKTFSDTASFAVSYAINHDMTHVNAKHPTYSEDGNIDYWYCEYCKKCYKDGAGRNEIAVEDTIIPKLTKPEGSSKTTHSSQSCAGSQDKNCDGVVTCEEVNGPGWVWSEDNKACVLNTVVVPSNTNTVYNFVNTSDR